MNTIIFNGSPREDGNCHFASKIIQETLDAIVYPLGRSHISPCISCGYCTKKYGKCSLTQKQVSNDNFDLNCDNHLFPADMADFYFNTLFNADKIIFISPIYFYNVPAQLKAFLDRTQTWFYTPQKVKAKQNRDKKYCGLILIGAREQGEKLFEGASLTFKYALDSLGYNCKQPLCLYGLDEKDALAKNFSHQREILYYAQNYSSFPIL